MLCYNTILDRDHIKKDIIDKLTFFEENKSVKSIKRGFYISGDCGIGKTEFVKKVLTEMNYDILHYTAGDIRNKSVIENMGKNNMADMNVVSMFKKVKKKIAIIMDEIDGLNSGDKGGISSLITIIRPKKTKKQMIELITDTPIFCISTNEIDKKTKELIKVCHYYDLKKPSDYQIKNIVDNVFIDSNSITKEQVILHSQNDLKKIQSLYKVYNKSPNVLTSILSKNVFVKKSVIEISKESVKTIYKTNIPFEKHNQYVNENDRTIVALLWHENVCDIIQKCSKKDMVLFYYRLLENMCYGDYIDRITFQKQIWQFNELSSFIKIMYNNYLMHNEFNDKDNMKNISEVRFTKVLTKYSTEFNNYVFFQRISNIMLLDKKDIITFYTGLRGNKESEDDIVNNYDVNHLDIQRLYRYIDNHKPTYDGNI
jgi:hypothetical protein